MLKSYHALATMKLAPSSKHAHPPHLPEVIHLSDSAAHVMVDFKYIEPVKVSPTASIDEALAELKAHTLPVLLVVDDSHSVVGIITSEDILGEKPVKLIQEGRLRRSEIPVSMVMTPHEDLAVFDIEHLRHAKVGNIIATLHLLKQPTILVIKFDEHQHNKQTVRGFFSASVISKQLGENITQAIKEAQSIAELQHELDA